MALKAGYKGIKKYIADKLNALGDLGELATDKEIAEATDKVRADIAPVLDEAKAPAGGITAGDQFYLNDILYTASADIAAGANIVVTGDGKNADVSLTISVQLSEKTDNSVIGPVEDESTVSQAYAVGEHFIRGGKFCLVIQAIAAGATLTKDTNYIEGNIAANINLVYGNISSVNPEITIDTTYNKAVRQGNVVFFKVRIVVASDLDTMAHALCALPFLSVLTQPHFSVRDRNAPYQEICGCYLHTNGRINISGVALLAGTYDISGTYICE